MGWNRKSTGRIAQNTPSRNSDSPPRRPSDAERRTKVYVRINSLPYSAHVRPRHRKAAVYPHTPTCGNNEKNRQTAGGSGPTEGDTGSTPAPQRATPETLRLHRGRHQRHSASTEGDPRSTPAPQGSNYSITAGETQANPRKESSHIHTAPKGSNFPRGTPQGICQPGRTANGPLLFNTENAFFPCARSVACEYTKTVNC